MRFLICILVVSARVAGAQPAPKSEADKLFKEGIALFDQGKFDEACEKFEQSIARDPHAIGTLMNLGRCNERRGKVATALKRFQEAYDRASQANAIAMRDAAQERIGALTGQVPVVTISRAGPPLEGEKLVVDDEVIALTRTELLLDPGTHTFVLTAPGRLPYETKLHVTTKTTLKVELPVLQVPKQDTVRIRASSRRIAGKVGTFGGAGLILVASGVALYAKRDYDKQFDDPDGSGPLMANCDPIDKGCNEAGHSRTQRDRNIAITATVVGAVGLAAAATGIVLWITAPTEERTVTPTLGPTSVGVSFSGRF